ncbi:DUF4173 domain-containing protein [Sporolactobacillus shoreicorticis]|uniref:DUF4153 domain-containing protein n=1 Tax=Sporolactobacillus shoreicorticis TaxID=1923877 RepID=A0ABW5RYN6_9BACL|nr:DUF4173 domain-containing protein [Sporolactobacillus shoreicorticis]MCO7124738.1 DUF4173 domain-containing protein [Sporolactobacillus shoreicorticis]
MEEFSTTKMLKEQSDHPILHNRSSRLLLCTLLLGVLANWFFFNQFPGISIPLFVFAFYSVFLLNTYNIVAVRRDFSGYLMIPIFLLSLTYLIFSNMIFFAMNLLAIPILIVTQTTLAAGRSKSAWDSVKFIGDVFLGFVYRPFAFLFLPFHLIAKRLNKGLSVGKSSTLIKVLLGVLIAVPLVVIVVSLLASADEVFSYFLGSIPELFAVINLDQFVPRLIFTAVIALCSFSYIWSLIAKRRPLTTFREPEDSVSLTNSIDQVVAATVLSILNVIYVFFILIQFSYLFGSFSFALPQQLTYAEYARRGFLELVLVTLINFSILLALIYWTKKDSKVMDRTIQVLESLLVGCTLIMLCSAFIRMYLYEQMYGFTYLRVLTHAFMILLFVLFIFTLCRIWNIHVKLFKYYLLTAITAFLLINYANIDVLITKWNIERYGQTGKIDVAYLFSLSDSAIPQLTGLLQAKDEAVSAKTENYLYERKKELNEGRSWQSFNLSSDHARRILATYDLHYNRKYDSYDPGRF